MVIVMVDCFASDKLIFFLLQLHLSRRVEMRGLRLQEVSQPERRGLATHALQPGTRFNRSSLLDSL